MAEFDPDLVQKAFDGASDYDPNARIQRRISGMMAQRIAQLNLPPRPEILEIGCGTGFLTRAMLDAGISANWLVTDKAAEMVERCRAAVGQVPDMRFSQLDGEYDMADHAGRYDLICASMAMQWFDDLGPAVERLTQCLKPGGRLIFNTLASGTFHEWRDAHMQAGAQDGAIHYAPIADLKLTLAPFAPLEFEADHLVEEHEDARCFLRSLKAIGAATPRTDHAPLPVSTMREVMRAFDASGARITYELVTCHIAKAKI